VSLEGKVALVTGAASGIGRAVAARLESAGMRVLAVALRPDPDRPEDRVLEDVILAPHVVKQLIEPGEVADVVAFLAGPRGRAFTGVPVTMDQGWTAR
jgi:NAD(P)-dependent dehydrogenase (short-subunit alcohol dehydrogenase family)